MRGAVSTVQRHRRQTMGLTAGGFLQRTLTKFYRQKNIDAFRGDEETGERTFEDMEKIVGIVSIVTGTTENV